MHNFFFNELSLGNNIQTALALQEGMKELCSFCTTVRGAQHTPYVHLLAFYNCQVMGLNLRSALKTHGGRDLTSRVCSLIDKMKPALPEDALWDESITVLHGGTPVPDTALAECATRIYMECDDNCTYSLSSSPFTTSSLKVTVQERNKDVAAVDVPNFWQCTAVETHLESIRAPFSSWEELLTEAERTLEHVCFEDYVQQELKKNPFAANVAEEVYRRLKALEEMCAANAQDFPALCAKYMHGDKAWFSGSSEDEMRNYVEELSFVVNGQKVLCPFHGKVKIQQYRIHTEAAPAPGRTATVVYIGPKLTKR